MTQSGHSRAKDLMARIQQKTSMKITLLIAVIALLGGCYRILSSSYQPSETMLGDAQTYAVIRGDVDYRDLSTIICQELARRGFSASVIYEHGESGEYDVLVRYESSWAWDMNWYLLALGVGFYDEKSDQLLLGSTNYRTSLVQQSPETSVSFLIDQLFGASEDEEALPDIACVSGDS